MKKQDIKNVLLDVRRLNVQKTWVIDKIQESEESVVNLHTLQNNLAVFINTQKIKFTETLYEKFRYNMFKKQIEVPIYSGFPNKKMYWVYVLHEVIHSIRYKNTYNDLDWGTDYNYEEIVAHVGALVLAIYYYGFKLKPEQYENELCYVQYYCCQLMLIDMSKLLCDVFEAIQIFKEVL